MTRGLPGVLAEIAEVAGEAAALKIAARFGGQRVYFPARPGAADHWLVATVGPDAAAKLCAHFSVDRKRGNRIEIPLHVGGSYRQFLRAISERLHALDQEGMSSREIAARLGLTQRTVHRHRGRHRGKTGDDQKSLF
ncbi:helix-turn-helix domain-containing protein [Rhodopseudomonas palustris]|uniref:Helix-turn-helix domain-containing protein n=1 Tax=Rhodopseudomonas palustris TaxID=1076 RepID=A0A418V4B8_RHOPL|nr:helix-turn-helix domain-containing protein [Rhodopseudomonas palustris]RJF70892.1 helix-turn-helix domain-containing protein [Rhodopseudomonas palustris]